MTSTADLQNQIDLALNDYTFWESVIPFEVAIVPPTEPPTLPLGTVFEICDSIGK